MFKNIIFTKKIYYEFYFYFIVSLLFILRNYLFIPNSIVKRLCSILYYSQSIYYCYCCIREFYNDLYLKKLNALFGIIMFYSLIFFITGVDNTWLRKTSPLYYFSIHFESIIPIYVFYYFTKKGFLNDNFFKCVAVLYFCMSIYEYSKYYEIIIKYENVEIGTFVNNMGYTVLSLIPILAFFKKQTIILYIGLSIVMFYTLSSFKRGAILITVISICVYLYYTLKGKITKKKILLCILCCLAIYIFEQYIINTLFNNSLFVKRINWTLQGSASHRDEIYIGYLNYYINNNIFQIFWGNGAFATCHYLGLMAHNDWIEFLIDLGLIGASVYLIYWIGNVKIFILSKKYSPEHISLIILMFTLVYFFKSLFSMSIMSMPYYSTSVIGYAMARSEIDKNVC